jgi:hypothetical protein
MLRPSSAGDRAKLLATGRVEITLATDWRKAKINFPPGLKTFALEGLYQSATLRYSELMLFGEGSLPPQYVHAHLAPCTLVSNEHSLVIYPQVKLFATGVVFVEFRLLAPRRPIPAKEFIEEFVNAPLQEFQQTYVPPGLAAWAPIATAEEGTFRWYRRPYMAYLGWSHKREVARRLTVAEHGDFTFQEILLQRNASDTTGETFHALALTIMEVVALLSGGNRRGLWWLLLGPKSNASLGGHWTGRPHTHLLRFENQAEKASENEKRFGDDFGSIIARTSFSKPSEGRRFLPRSSRPIEDFAAYLSLGGTLWVHTRRSLKEYGNVPWADANSGHLIHEHQVKAELLDYAYTLHRRIAEHTVDEPRQLETVFEVQRELSRFEWAVQDVSRFGEIRELLEEGWNAIGVTRLRTRIAEMLHLSQTEITHRDAVTGNRRTAFLAVLAGLLAVPPLASVVVGPLWRLLGLPLPRGTDATDVLLAGVAVLLVGLVMAVAFWWTRRD